MRIGLPPIRRMWSVLFLAPLVIAACGGGQAAAPTSTPKPAAPSQSSMPGGMQVPAWADAMKVKIQSPTDGSKITGNQVTVNVSFSGFTPTCAAGGQPVKGQGHYHVMLDNSLVDMFCTPQATVSMQNVKPGSHTLSVVPALSDHADVQMNMQSVKIDYEPTNPLPEIQAAASTGTPSIKITSPQPGASVSGDFDVKVQISNFHSTCDLEGRPDVAGYGHWHVNIDTTNSAMGGMATMMRMACGDTMYLTTKGLSAGKHTLIAYLADNQHAPINPMVAAQLQINVTGS